MNDQDQRYLPVINGASGTWGREVAQAQRSGTNFLIVLPVNGGTKGEFCQAVQLEPGRLPKPLRKSNLFLLSPHIQPEAFDQLLGAMESGGQVFFLEQLDLPTTQPPRVKPYLVYCDVWGILSQHSNMYEARQSWSDYLHEANVQRAHPEPGIYKWDGQAWHSLEE
jgi:hypothetical protein